MTGLQTYNFLSIPRIPSEPHCCDRSHTSFPNLKLPLMERSFFPSGLPVSWSPMPKALQILR